MSREMQSGCSLRNEVMVNEKCVWIWSSLSILSNHPPHFISLPNHKNQLITKPWIEEKKYHMLSLSTNLYFLKLKYRKKKKKKFILKMRIGEMRDGGWSKLKRCVRMVDDVQNQHNILSSSNTTNQFHLTKNLDQSSLNV